MGNDQFIAVAEFCRIYQTDISFIQELEEYGLVEITIQEQSGFIDNDQLPQLEQFIRLHEELEINPAGIDAINNLLHKVEQMQLEIRELRNRLRQFDA